MTNSTQQYIDTLTDIAEDIQAILDEKYPRVSDLNMLRRKADRLGVMLGADYIKSVIGPTVFDAKTELYYAAELYLKLHRFDLVRRNLVA